MLVRIEGILFYPFFFNSIQHVLLKLLGDISSLQVRNKVWCLEVQKMLVRIEGILFYPFFVNSIQYVLLKLLGDISSLQVRNKVCACLDVSTSVSKYHFESHYDDTNPKTNALGPSLHPKMTYSFPRKIVEELDKENYQILLKYDDVVLPPLTFMGVLIDYSLNSTRGLRRQS